MTYTNTYLVLGIHIVFIVGYIESGVWCKRVFKHLSHTIIMHWNKSWTFGTHISEVALISVIRALSVLVHNLATVMSQIVIIGKVQRIDLDFNV